MADVVQALELQIKDNAGTAADSLTKLAASLSKIKRAVSKDFDLKPAAQQISTFVQSVTAIGSESNIQSVNRLTKALARLVQNAEKLKSLGVSVRQATGGAQGYGSTYDTTGTRSLRTGRHSAAYFERIREASTMSMEAKDSDIATVSSSLETAKANVSDLRREFESLGGQDTNVKRLANSVRELGHVQQHQRGARSSGNFMGEGVKPEFTPTISSQLLKAADDLYTSGELNTKAWKAVREQIEGIDATKMFGSHGKQEMKPYEAQDIVRDMAGSLVAGKASGGNTSMQDLMKDIDYAVSKSGGVEELTQRIEGLKAALAEKVSSGKIADGSEAYFKQVAAIDRLVEKRNKLIAQTEKQAEAERQLQHDMETSASAVMSKSAAGKMADAYISGQNGAAAMKEQLAQASQKADELRAKLTSGLRTGQLDATGAQKLAASIREADEEVKKLKSDLSLLGRVEATFKNAASSISAGFHKVKSAIMSANGGLLGFVSGMARMAKYRMFRALIREISEGFQVGLENVRAYSKQIDGLYNRDMKGLDNELLLMKNSLGAMAAQIAQALIPVFKQLASWVVEVSNVINQFVALLTGKTTWTKAVYAEAEAIEDSGKAASGAAKQMKGLLASWDELNIIQSESGGGGSGKKNKTETDYTKMFEESSEFTGWIKDAVTWLEDHTALVNGAIAGIAASLLGLNGAAVLMTIGIVTSYSAGYEMGKNDKGFFENVQESLFGMVEGALAGFLIAKSLGGGLHGAMIGFAVGASVSLATNFIGWMIGNYEAEGNASFAANLQKDLVEIIPTVLSYSAMGLIAGTVVGHPVAGAAVGFTLGAAISLAASYIDWNKEKSNGAKTYSAMDDALGLSMVTALAGAGAFIGWKVGKVKGALIGATVGLGVGLVLKWINYQKEQNAATKIENYGDITADADAIGEDVKKFFRYDVDVYVSVTKASIENLTTQRELLVQGINKLTSSSMVLTKIGIENASEEDVKQLGEEVSGVVDGISQYLKEQDKFVTISLATSASFTDAESGEVITRYLKAGEDIDQYVRGLGKQIGDILEDGIIEGVEEANLYKQLTEKLSRVTNAIVNARSTAQFTSDVEELSTIFERGGFTKKTMLEYQEAYLALDDELMSTARAHAKETEIDMKTRLAALEEMQAQNPTAERAVLISGLKEDIRTYDVKEETKRLYNTYAAEGLAIAQEVMRSGWERVRATSLAGYDPVHGNGGNAIERYIGLKSNVGLAQFDNPFMHGKRNELLNGEVPIQEFINNLLAELFDVSTDELGSILQSTGLSAWEMLGEGWQQHVLSRWGEMVNYDEEKMIEFAKLINDAYGDPSGVLKEYLNLTPAGSRNTVDFEIVPENIPDSIYGVPTGNGQGPYGTVSGNYAIGTNNGTVTYNGTTPEVPGDEGKSSEPNENDVEQTGYLREMSNSLADINRKEFSVRLVPSAALGSVVRRSLDQYERVSGVT